MKKILSLFILIPSVSYAMPATFAGFISLFLDLVYIIIPILVALSFIAFFWGIAQFILAAGQPEARKEGRKFMMGGLLALFVLVSFWSILQFASNELGFGVLGIPRLPGGQIESADSRCIDCE